MICEDSRYFDKPLNVIILIIKIDIELYCKDV